MQYPIIEFRQKNFFVSNNFEGNISKLEITRRFNLHGNLTEYIVDSSGKVWTLLFVKNNFTGFRKIVSPIWNVSSEIYTYTTDEKKNVKWLRGVLSGFLASSNSDIKDLAMALMESLGECEDSMVLSSITTKLNL
jgi:hypothetical protein